MHDQREVTIRLFAQLERRWNKNTMIASASCSYRRLQQLLKRASRVDYAIVNRYRFIVIVS